MFSLHFTKRRYFIVPYWNKIVLNCHKNGSHIGIGHELRRLDDIAIDVLRVQGSGDDLRLSAQSIVLGEVQGLGGAAQV